MLRFSIRKMMLVVAGAALFFAVMMVLLDSVNRPTGGGLNTKCASNIRNVALAVLGYVNAKGVYPDGTWSNADLGLADRLSWYAPILPYLDEQERYDSLETDQPWDVGENDVLAHSQIGVLSCPGQAAVAAGAPVPAFYVGIAGVGANAPLFPKSDRRAGVFGYDREAKLTDIKDGAANTMMIAETGKVSGSWLQGGPATIRGLDPAQQPYIGPGRQFGGMHGGGGYIAFADGSVRRVSESVDPVVFEALSTMAGGERLPKDW
jgi:prepilin-type processing-associated H-X9-DG protein